MFEYVPEVGRVAYVHDQVRIFPLRAINAKNGHVCYSFFGVPNKSKPKFLPNEAKKLGCNPKQHFNKLSNGETVELEDGTQVTPEMVTQAAPPA